MWNSSSKEQWYVAADEQKDGLRKEIMSLKRSLAEETYEKDAIQTTSNNLRNMVKKTEGEKLELNRLLQEANQRVTGNG